MDIKKVKDFKEGDHVNVNLLISSLTRGITNSGAPYLTLTLQDSTKSIDAKLWDVKSEVEKELQVGKVFNFDLEINLYRNNLQAKVIKVFPLNQAELDMSDYIFNSPIPKDDLRNSIAEGINQINNEIFQSASILPAENFSSLQAVLVVSNFSPANTAPLE